MRALLLEMGQALDGDMRDALHVEPSPAGAATIILVTGVPASGKSTLSRLLADTLQLPILSKDVVKEALHDSLGTADPVAVSQASAEVIWRLLPHFPAGAIVDMWLDPVRDAGVAADGLRRAGTSTDAVEIQCRCPGDVAVDRYRHRPRSPAHRGPDPQTLARIQDSAGRISPTGIGPFLAVDSTKPFVIPPIVAWIGDIAKAGRSVP